MVNPNYTQINAAQQVNDPDSVFCFYQQLLRLRKQHDVFLYGTYELMLPDSEPFGIPSHAWGAPGTGLLQFYHAGRAV